MSTEVLSFKVGSTLAAQRGVYLSAAQTVGYPTNTASAPIGITTDTVLNTNQAIPVQCEGIAKLLFNDTVSAGALVALDSSGRGVPAAGTTLTNTYVIGRLVGSAVAATGTIAEVLINPHPVFNSL